MAYQRKYLLGRYYYTLEGKVVKIINESLVRGYECVKGDDGIWRYDREGKYENGRVTGTKCYPPDLRNFADGAWLNNSKRVNEAFGGTDFEHHNSTTIKAVEMACIELDRLYDLEKAVDISN